MEKVRFTPQEGEAVDFYVLEQTMIGGVNYLLVTDTEDDDGEALILCDVSAPEDTEDEKLNAVAAVFENMMDDINIIQ